MTSSSFLCSNREHKNRQCLKVYYLLAMSSLIVCLMQSKLLTRVVVPEDDVGYNDSPTVLVKSPRPVRQTLSVTRNNTDDGDSNNTPTLERRSPHETTKPRTVSGKTEASYNRTIHIVPSHNKNGDESPEKHTSVLNAVGGPHPNRTVISSVTRGNGTSADSVASTNQTNPSLARHSQSDINASPTVTSVTTQNQTTDTNTLAATTVPRAAPQERKRNETNSIQAVGNQGKSFRNNNGTVTHNSSSINQQVRQQELHPNHNDQLNPYTDRRAPRVILHIGPHKTGTTAIQNLIHRKETREVLAQDNIDIPDYDALPGGNTRYPEFNFAACMLSRYHGGRSRKACLKKTLPPFSHYLNESYARGMDILMVAEDFDRPEIDIDRIKKSLKPYTDIQIIVTYRRLHDWFKSWYNEIIRLYQNRCLAEKGFISYTEWLQQEGEYDQFFKRHTMELQARYQSYNLTVNVFHFHRNQTSLLENLFCEDYMDAPNTCNALKFNQIKRGGHQQEHHSRVSKQEEFEICRLVWMAKDFQVTGKLRGCEGVAEAYLPLFQKWNISIRHDFPVTRFPQDVVDRVWNHTVEAEFKYYSQLHNGEEHVQQPTPVFWKELRKEFDHAIDTKWYASDMEEIKRSKVFDHLMAEHADELTTDMVKNSTTVEHADFNATIAEKNTTVWNCLLIKDADLYIDEWMDYNFALGFTFVRVYDNSDNFTMRDWSGKDDMYKDKIKVTHHPNIEGKVGTQAKAYKECIEEAVAQDVDWVGTIDVDEFLVLKKHTCVADLMNYHCPKQKKCGQLSFNWRMFGSANQTKYHPVPVTRRFQYMTNGWQGTIKVIVDPKAVDLRKFRWNHSLKLNKGFQWLDTNGEIIKNNKGWRAMTNDKNPSDVAVLHHYRYKSQEEWDHSNCVRGNEYDFKAKERCNTTAEAGFIHDDSAWQLLRKMVPRYQMYDEVAELV